MNQGFGDGMSRAFELVATPLVFGGIGFLVDAVAGTEPVFMVALGLFGVIGTLLRVWYGYDHEMREHEAGAPWSPTRRIEPDEADLDVDLWRRRDADRPTNGGVRP